MELGLHCMLRPNVHAGSAWYLAVFLSDWENVTVRLRTNC